MRKVNRFTCGLALVALFGILLTACKKEPAEEFNPSRLFMPGRINVSTEETRAILGWDASLLSAGKNLQYTVELARDSSFQTILATKVVDTVKAIFTDSELSPRQNYVARVKANTYNGTAESKWEISPRFSITGEQIFKPLAAADIIDRAVKLKWVVPNAVTKIVITPASGTAIDAIITPAEATVGEKIISNLSASTTYSAEIFTGTRSRGFLTFTTTAGVSGNLIDLRSITGRPSVLADTLPLIADGSTVILNRNETYVISSALNLSKAVTIMSGPDLTATNKAVVNMLSNFNIVSGSTISSIVFRDIVLRSDSYSGKYVFNINTACNIGTMSFESCVIEIFRGVVRTQSNPAIIGNFNINDCIVDSISNYGVITVDVASSSANNITIRNSTIYKAEKVITSRNNSNTVVISNSTFNETPAANNYLIDYSTSGTNNVSGGVTIENSIFGSGKAAGAVRGVRVGAGTAILANNNYSTSDYVLATSPLPIPNVTAYSASSIALWEDPRNGDFRLKDQGFPGKSSAGDPRWRP